MNENIKILLEKLSKDEAIGAKLKTITDPDEAFALVSSIQGGYTKEEFVEAMKAVAAAGSGELSDDEVAAAAGGMSSNAKSIIVSLSNVASFAASNAV